MAKFNVEYKLVLRTSDGSETKYVKMSPEDAKPVFSLIDSLIGEGWSLEFLTVRRVPEKKPAPVKVEKKP